MEFIVPVELLEVEAPAVIFLPVILFSVVNFVRRVNIV